VHGSVLNAAVVVVLVVAVLAIVFVVNRGRKR
jgi:hypothetical protein